MSVGVVSDRVSKYSVLYAYVPFGLQMTCTGTSSACTPYSVPVSSTHSILSILYFVLGHHYKRIEHVTWYIREL